MIEERNLEHFSQDGRLPVLNPESPEWSIEANALPTELRMLDENVGKLYSVFPLAGPLCPPNADSKSAIVSTEPQVLDNVGDRTILYMINKMVESSHSGGPASCTSRRPS